MTEPVPEARRAPVGLSDRSAFQTSLKFLGPQWFAIVMGWAGLAQAWHRAVPLMGEEAHWFAVAAAIVAAAMFALVCAALVWRMRLHPAALAEDLAHPLRHPFAAALPVSMLLLALAALTVGGGGPAARTVAHLLFWPGAALQFAASVWVIGRIVRLRLEWPAVTPVLFIPIVGNVVVPLPALLLGAPELGWFFLGIGAFFWPIATTLNFVRTAQLPVPDRIAPSWTILAAPPALVGIDLIALGGPPQVGFAMLGIAALFVAIALLKLHATAGTGFSIAWWGISFPFAAFTTLLELLAVDAVGLRVVAIASLAAVSLAVLWLSSATWKALRAGTLLAPEPVAMMKPAD
ncbi:MAG: C4-dicarboxylate ABC transporter [Lautropia sp.]